jgi:DNA-binding transcriptional regulator of glucitol operon
MPRWTTANVLRAAGDTKRLWQFALRGENPHLTREESKLPTESLPQKLISKDWQTLYQPRLNIAWLPADKAFLRVIQLPPADTMEETVSMLDLQLEKLSPLPVAQIVWTFDLLPRQGANTQTAIVVIAPRNLVEDYLGKLEGHGYVADRLEVPFIDQLLATKIDHDGVWIYPGEGADKDSCLVAWWYGGVLQTVNLLHLPAEEERAAFIHDQLAQMMWAGELEGWLTGPGHRVLVADGELATTWRALLDTPEQPVEVVPPAPEAGIAAMTARRAASDGARTSLVPPEFTARYRQQFVDRMWMRAILAVIVVYLIIAVLYIGWLQYIDYDVSHFEQRARALQGSYTNAMKLKAQVQVMEDQLNLQFAALRCYRAVAEKLPQALTVESLTFQRGKTLLLSGNGEASSQPALNEFNGELRKYTVDGQPLFSHVNAPQITIKGNGLTWNFQCELKTTETE